MLILPARGKCGQTRVGASANPQPKLRHPRPLLDATFILVCFVTKIGFSSQMKSRIVLFSTSAIILVLARAFSSRAKRRGCPFLSSASTAFCWSPCELLVASFLTLFAELAFIRWIAVEIRVFAYFKNLALLLCFVGFGLGCALASQAVRWPASVKALFGLLLVVRLPWHSGRALEGISQTLGSAADVELWTNGVSNWVNFLCVALLTAILFLFLVWIFTPLGQVVGRQMILAPNPLTAYSYNLLGSLIGILAFLGLSWLMLQPWVWLGGVLAGFSLLQTRARDRTFLLALIVPVVLLLYDPASPNHYAVWTPYQQIEYSRMYARSGEFAEGVLKVNHTGYQAIVNLSTDFLARHPDILKERPDENPFNVPFRFVGPAPSVLILGSGTGNDVAAALRHNSSAVDAVEIDPAILALGKHEHPEHPYDSALVSVHLTDARAFLKRSSRSYDLILFGLLDSHTEFSDYSNMRIDNFIYTMESFNEARKHLNPDGVLFIKFVVVRPWIGRRLSEMLEQAFGKSPVVFYAGSSYTPAAICFAVSPSNRVNAVLSSDIGLSEFVSRNHFSTSTDRVPVATDDWPYLYQRDRSIPRAYLSLGVLVILVSIALYSSIPNARGQPPSLFFFSMGAGFMLLETQAVSRLALYFGTTWQVNGIVICALLIALLIANQIAGVLPKSLSSIWIFVPLLTALILAYRVPFSSFSSRPAVVGTLLAVIFSLPVIFAALLFSIEFAEESGPAVALGANVLGAVCGGLLENLSLLLGMRALLPISVGIYCIAAVALFVGKSKMMQGSGRQMIS
jgi:SAM-dependent methyltransferase